MVNVYAIDSKFCRVVFNLLDSGKSNDIGNFNYLQPRRTMIFLLMISKLLYIYDVDLGVEGGRAAAHVSVSQN